MYLSNHVGKQQHTGYCCCTVPLEKVIPVDWCWWIFFALVITISLFDSRAKWNVWSLNVIERSSNAYCVINKGGRLSTKPTTSPLKNFCMSGHILLPESSSLPIYTSLTKQMISPTALLIISWTNWELPELVIWPEHEKKPCDNSALLTPMKCLW